MATEEDIAAKRRFIERFFDDMDERFAFLLELREGGRTHEAMLLCCAYLDGLANQMYRDPGSRRNFVRLFAEVGAPDFLLGVHLKQLRDSLERMDGRKVAAVVAAFNEVDDCDYGRLHTEPEVLALLGSFIGDGAREWLSCNLWRGTLAAIAYDHLRSPAIHGLGSANAMSFDETSFNNGPVPKISFDVLYNVLQLALDKARIESESTNRWFGHD